MPATAPFVNRLNMDKIPQPAIPIAAKKMKKVFFLLKSASVPKIGQRITETIATMAFVRPQTVLKLSEGKIKSR